MIGARTCGITAPLILKTPPRPVLGKRIPVELEAPNELTLYAISQWTQPLNIRLVRISDPRVPHSGGTAAARTQRLFPDSVKKEHGLEASQERTAGVAETTPAR